MGRLPARVAGAWKTIAIVAAVVAGVGATAGYAVYRQQVAPFAATVLRVDDTTVDMRYLLNRILLSGREPLTVLEAIGVERIIALSAPLPPYDIQVTEEDVEARLRQVALGQDETIAEEAYQEWYRQRVNESRLTEEQFRELVRMNLLIDRLNAYLHARVPTVAEQARLHMVAGASREAVARFGTLYDGNEVDPARVTGLATELRLSNRDLGWLPRGALSPEMAQLAFDRLEPGEPSNPFPLPDGRFAVMLVAERVPARAIEDRVLQAMRQRAVETWIAEERANHEVVYGDPEEGWTSETEAWVRSQVETLRAEDGS